MTDSGTMTQDMGKSNFVQHAHAVTHTAEKFHIEGMHTFHTETSDNTLGERDLIGSWEMSQNLYTNARSKRTHEVEGRPKYKFKNTFENHLKAKYQSH